MAGFQLKRLGLLMEPESGDPLGIEEVLEPTDSAAEMFSFIHPRVQS
jgi:hypothetical protein